MGNPGCAKHAFHRDFELKDEIARTADDIRYAVNIFRSKVSVGARSNRDAVLRLCIHQNQGCTRSLVGTQDAGGVDSFFAITFNGIVSEDVVSYFADKAHVSPEPACRYGLIGALASGTHYKDSSKYGLTRLRQAFRFYSHIGVAAADYYNFSISHYKLNNLVLVR